MLIKRMRRCKSDIAENNVHHVYMYNTYPTSIFPERGCDCFPRDCTCILYPTSLNPIDRKKLHSFSLSLSLSSAFTTSLNTSIPHLCIAFDSSTFPLVPRTFLMEYLSFFASRLLCKLDFSLFKFRPTDPYPSYSSYFHRTIPFSACKLQAWNTTFKSFEFISFIEEIPRTRRCIFYIPFQ